MMEITYKDIHDFDQQELQDLFLSVEWSSGHYPEKLVVAMKHFETVYTAWDGKKLVHYLLVRPEYQHLGIGKRLVEMMKEHYVDYLRIVIVAYNEELEFYQSCGFKKADDASPMFITSLWT